MTEQIVVITGASSGIGQATADRFTAGGARVYNLDLTAPAAPTAGAIWRHCDVTDHEQVAARIGEIVREDGRVDVAIANAGISIRRPFLEMKPAEIDTLLAINVRGVINLWQAAGRQMYEAGSGVLLATASTNATAGYPWYADYNASKAAVLALCRSVALELAPRVRTACVSPGYVMTPMQRLEYTDEMIDEVNAKIPSGRHAEPAEIASAFYFLASAEAAFITGQQLVVDGGELAGGTASSYRTWQADRRT
ncbi:SDR family NAD(P)-dependent oxidoreductase [Glaciibacter psychrotolerans]|uniref:NAD(P)-dependent dehydrogenase (Short-subunit alcohol dehydrogenase family) n=1 Tax=Glaciibacter psychrotolerans TaxID=670054 RepID=A0A7Z0J6J0_9MICO|nr:SDR family oxidoreductase [Leifsonia psychrotolerans]NYJ20435.1 NAD(P)-dependent dehydrogenase (short-subunit alcohol dehydrogenase family) [Leifsonia psychrotolerans]